MPLILAPLNKPMKVVKLMLDEKTKKHFENLGLGVNSSIEVISSCGGNVIILVKESRIALDKDIASKIFVA